MQDFEGSLNDGLARLGLQVPSVSLIDGVFVFWSNRTCELGGRRWRRFAQPWPVLRAACDGVLACGVACAWHALRSAGAMPSPC